MWRLVLICACLTLAACGVRTEVDQGVPTGSAPTLAGNQRIAREFAKRELVRIHLPAGSTRATADPSPATLAQPQSRPGVAHLIDRHGFWRVPGTPTALLTWLRTHRPRGTQLTLSGSGADHGTVDVWNRGYSYRTIPKGVYLAELDITVARANGGGTAVRVDSYATALVPRPRWERIPGNVASVRVTVTSGRHSYPVADVSRPAMVSWLTAVFNRAEIIQGAEFISCPAFSPAMPQLRFEFIGASGSELARAAEQPCMGVSFSVEGRAGSALAPKVDLTSLLWSRHVLASCSALAAQALRIIRAPGPVVSDLPFRIRDVGTSACGLRGYPRIRLRLGRSAWTTPRVVPSQSRAYKPQPVLLDPSWPDTTQIGWPNRTCKARAYDQVQLRLPGVRTPLVVRLRHRIAPCGGRITVYSL